MKRTEESILKGIETRRKNGSLKHSEATKAKMSASAPKKHSVEHTQNSAKARAGGRWITDGSNDTYLCKNSAIPEGWEYGRSKIRGRRPFPTNIGRKASEETKVKLRTISALRWKNPEYKARVSAAIKIAKEKQWKNHIRKDPRHIAAQSDWRNQVFIRDNYTCRRCGKIGGELHAHHIKSWALFPELRFDVENGKTLCKYPCHRDEHIETGNPVGLLNKKQEGLNDRKVG